MEDRVRLLLLWDVDNTLVTTSDFDRAVYLDIVRALLGVEDPVVPPPGGGLPESRMMVELLMANGADGRLAEHLAPSALGRFRRALTPEAVRDHGALLPGAKESLTEFSRMRGVTMSVATGNLRTVAEAKLAAFGLDTMVDLAIGGFGEGAGDKTRIVETARLRAGPNPEEPHPAHLTVLVGDALSDAEASSVSAVLGVASGRASTRELSEAGATRVIEDLRDIDAVVASVFGAMSDVSPRAHTEMMGRTS